MIWWHQESAGKLHPGKVRSMERGMESGEEEQDKQSTRARVTARWEEKLNDGGGCDNR